jgi:hypothetical protein
MSWQKMESSRLRRFLNGQKFEDADSASKAISAVTQDQIKRFSTRPPITRQNSGVQRHACCLWILSGRGMGVHTQM